MASEHWRTISAKVRAAAKARCCACSAPALIVHHDDYREATLMGLDLSGLYCICVECHRLVERTETNGKRSMAQARSMLAKLLGRKPPARARPPESIEQARATRAAEVQRGVDKKKGADFRRAKSALLDAEHAEALRAYNTVL